MPWAYWLALALFGGLTVLILGANILSLATGGSTRLGGALVFAIILGTLIWFDGPRRAYALPSTEAQCSGSRRWRLGGCRLNA